ncbi:MAG: ABC-F family ATP-binding cassette domain-containing protein [Waddliaceae bacterium]
MIRFSSVTKSYGKHTLFEDANFTLGKGERCGVVGRNGSGKSTLFRLITGEESPDEGKIVIPKDYRIGTLQQHIKFSKNTIIKEAMSSLPPNEQDEEYRGEIILTGLGFSLDQMDLDPRTLSGGYQLRLQLTKVLLAEPDCLLLDEPTNYLDIVAIRWLESFLKQWCGEIMIVSHDKAFMNRVVTHTIGIYRHEVHKLAGDTDKFYSQMSMRDEIYEQTRVQNEKKRAHLQSFVDRFGAKASKAAQAKSKEKQLKQINVMGNLARIENLNFSFKMANFPGKKMLEMNNLHFSYDSAPTAHQKPFSIDDFSLTVEKGDHIAIIGKNGRGKSTILSLIAGHLKPKSGSWTGSDNLRIGHFGQTHIERLNPKLTVEKEIAAANPELAYGDVRRICGLVMFSGDQAKKTISVLSGGERSRVLLGKILATPCNLLLLDEPTHHLDMESVESLLDAVQNFPGAVILITHDEALLEQFGNRMLICRDGDVHHFNGDYNLFLEKQGWEAMENSSVASKASEPAPKKQKNQKSKPNKKQQQCEKEIIAAEETLAKLEKELEETIKACDHDAITVQSKKIGEVQKKIESLFSELESLV